MRSAKTELPSQIGLGQLIGSLWKSEEDGAGGKELIGPLTLASGMGTRKAMSSDARTFILANLKEQPGQTLPQLVKKAQTSGLTESKTRTAAQGMLEKGELLLGKSMELQVDGATAARK